MTAMHEVSQIRLCCSLFLWHDSLATDGVSSWRPAGANTGLILNDVKVASSGMIFWQKTKQVRWRPAGASTGLVLDDVRERKSAKFPWTCHFHIVRKLTLKSTLIAKELIHDADVAPRDLSIPLS